MGHFGGGQAGWQAGHCLLALDPVDLSTYLGTSLPFLTHTYVLFTLSSTSSQLSLLSLFPDSIVCYTLTVSHLLPEYYRFTSLHACWFTHSPRCSHQSTTIISYQSSLPASLLADKLHNIVHAQLQSTFTRSA